MARRAGIRRKAVTLRAIGPTRARQQDLARIYLKVPAAWLEALGPILDEYARTLAAVTTDSAADIEREIGLAELALQRLVLRLSADLRRWVLDMEEWHRGQWVGAVLSATGIDLSTILSPSDMRETVEAVLARNVALVKDLSAEAQGRIADAVFRGVNQRTPVREVAKELREAVGLSRKRAVRIAAHQSSNLTAELDTARMMESGVQEWIWRSSGKINYRPEHRARDGKIYTWENSPKDMPGVLWNCGCRKMAHISLDD